jgi:hypothetical protein
LYNAVCNCIFTEVTTNVNEPTENISTSKVESIDNIVELAEEKLSSLEEVVEKVVELYVAENIKESVLEKINENQKTGDTHDIPNVETQDSEKDAKEQE